MVDLPDKPIKKPRQRAKKTTTSNQERSFLLLHEKLYDNLSGRQITAILDLLLRGAVHPIATNTNLLRRGLAHLFFDMYNNPRRKLSSLARPLLVDTMFTAIVTTNQKWRWRLFKRLAVDRYLSVQLIGHFQKSVGNYLQTEKNYVLAKDHSEKQQYHWQMYKHQTYLGANSVRLGAAIRCVASYFQLYREFKFLVIGKYIKYVYQETLRTTRNTNLVIDQQDLFENLLLAVDRAIDKYSHDRGALTSYVQQWFRNARTNPLESHIYDQSYSIPASLRRHLHHTITGDTRNTFVHSLDQLELVSDSVATESLEEYVEEILNSEDLQDRIRPVARDYRWAFLLLNVPFRLTRQETALQRASCFNR